MNSLPNYPATLSFSDRKHPVTPGDIKKYKQEGYLVLRGLVDPEMAGRMHDEVIDIMSVIGLGHTKLRQTAQYLPHSLLAGYIHSRLLREIASTLMESKAHLYLPFTAVKSGGGGGRFHFHQDGNYTHYVQGEGINLWTALVPMREENGGLRMVPGSHQAGETSSENAGDGDGHRKVLQEPEKSILLEMEPGDCVAFTRWTVHGSGPNQSNVPRVAYGVQFHSDDAIAEWDGHRHLLRDEPRHRDIWGVDTIVPDNAGPREGH